MRILLIGKNGQVGWELQRTLMPLGEIISTDYPETDLADFDGTRNLIRNLQPQVIVNAAAYTAVDQAESEPELAFEVNSAAPGVLAEEARAVGALLIHYSTDYVFDGEKGSPYTEDDVPDPINTYGASKLAGEKAVQQVDGAYLILRTSWVYSLRSDSFVTKVLAWAQQQRALRIVTDQVASPTWCRLLAEVTAQVLAAAGHTPKEWLEERKGLYHLTGAGHASRFEFTRTIMENLPPGDANRAVEILPASSDEFPSPARRPRNSSLDISKFENTFGMDIPAWEVSLRQALEDHYQQ